jgi:pimeloyl-ACP methyl ester carboxylesterase
MLARFADRWFFEPSREVLPTEGKTRRLVAFNGGQLEVWTQRTPLPESAASGQTIEPALFVLKLGGMAGRGERATLHPFDFWADIPGEVWSPNAPGFGGSSGRATIQAFAASARAVLDELKEVAAGRPIVVYGNSLGTASALRLAAEDDSLAGLILRNPPPLRELIRGKFGWRTLGLGPLLVGSRVPAELDSVANAARCQVPAVFLMSMKDRTVPARYQQLISAAYAGPKQVVELADADHVFEMTVDEQRRYGAALTWLRERFAARLA